MPGNDFERSLRRARVLCGAIASAPVVLGVASWAARDPGRVPHEEPLAVAALAILAVLLVSAAPTVREEIAGRAIARALDESSDARDRETVYPTFTTAAVAAFAVLAMPVLFGYLATALTGSAVPFAVGVVVSCAGWVALWPRRLLWERWTWQAKLTRDPDPKGPV